MLCAALNKSLDDHLPNKELYGNIPPITTSKQQQRMPFTGYCWHSKGELAAELLLWNQSHGRRSRGRPRKSYIDQLAEDAGCREEALAAAMNDRVSWRNRDCILFAKFRQFMAHQCSSEEREWS